MSDESIFKKNAAKIASGTKTVVNKTTKAVEKTIDTVSSNPVVQDVADATKSAVITGAKIAADKAVDTKNRLCAPEVNIFVQYDNRETSHSTLVAKAIEHSGVNSAKTVTLYIKPEEKAVYYVVNKTIQGKISL